MSVKELREIWRDNPIIYRLYYLAGGIYTSDKFSKRVKNFCFALSAFDICMLATCAVGYFLTVSSATLLDKIMVFSINSGVIFTQIIYPLVLLHYESNIRTVLEYIVENSFDGTNAHVDESKLLSTKRVDPFPKKMMVGIIFGILLYVLAPFLDFAFNYEEKLFGHSIEHHNIGVPYMYCISSIFIYWAVYLFETLVFIVPLGQIFSQSLLMETITRGLNNIVCNFCGRFQRLNALLEDKMSPSEVSPELLSYYQKKLVSLIKQYEILLNTIKLLRLFIVINCAIVMPGFFCFTALQLFAHFLADFSFVLKMRLLILTLFAQAYMYPYCKFGSAIEEMQDEIAYQVYNLPWYCLSPRRRKDIYIFLTQTQQFLPLKIFNVFPVNKILFPKISRLAYTYVNVLAAVMKSDNRRMK